MLNNRKKSGSTTSTTCSTPPPHDIYSILISEENRYKRKGYGLISASIIALSFMILGPMMLKKVWPVLLEMMEIYGW